MFAVFLHHLSNSLLPPLPPLSPQSIIDVPWNRCVDSFMLRYWEYQLVWFSFLNGETNLQFYTLMRKKENDKISMFTEHGWKIAKKWMDFLYKSKLFSFPFLFYLPLSWKRAKREILESFQYQPSLFCPTAILAKTISFSIEPFHPGECQTREWESKTSLKSFRNSSTFTDLKNQKLIYCWL